MTNLLPDRNHKEFPIVKADFVSPAAEAFTGHGAREFP